MEKNQPEKSTSFNKRDDDDHKSDTGTSLAVTESPKVAPAVEEGAAEKEIKEAKEEGAGERVDKTETDEITEETKTTEEESPASPPPEIQYTLQSVSEDIDNFLPTLSAPKEEAVEAAVVAAAEEEAAEADEEKKEKASIEIPKFVEKFLDLVEEKITKHDSGEPKVKWCQSPEDDASFLEAVDRISRVSKSLAEHKSDSSLGSLINRVGGIQYRAMAYLEDEFRSLLEEFKTVEAADQSGSDSKSKQESKQEAADQCALPDQSSESAEHSSFPGYSQEVLANMNKIAKEMISGGYESECCQVYIMARRNGFDENLSKLGFEKISIDDVQKMSWEALEREIPTWIKAFKQCATVFFSGERKLAEAVFREYPSLSDCLFSNLTRGVMIQLLNFVEAVAMTKRSAEKLFKFLDMYEALRDNLPAVDELFSEDCVNEIRTETSTTRCRIGEAAICMFCELENSIKADTGKTPVPGGAVHPLTRYTLNYLKYACEYKDTLEQVFREHSKIERADSTSRPRYEGETQNYNEGDRENQSPFSNQLMRIMDLLDANLEGKSKLYRDIPLSCIFMMNNGRYILQKVKGSAEIHQVMGDTWCRKRSSDLRNYHKGYQRETWTKLLGCLGHEGLTVNGKVVKPVLKERFKSFNAMFDEIHKTQSLWVISDEQLQSELRVSISSVMIPAYRSFLARFSQYLDPGRQTEKYIKFQPEDIEDYIDDLFDGNPTTSMAKRKP